MRLTLVEKEKLKKELVVSLRDEPEITKIVVFGSFLTANEPHDLDVAVFQNSNLAYLSLAMKYRKKIRTIARRIAVDILPVKSNAQDSAMLDAIDMGEIIYER